MESSTKILRRMLDERGVEWWQKKRHTCWKVGKGQEVEMWRAWEAHDGSLTLKVDYIYDLTPEQAIAATLGAGTCKVEWRENGWGTRTRHCGKCGADLDCDTRNRQNYCPSCGAKIVGSTKNDVDAEVDS